MKIGELVEWDEFDYKKNNQVKRLGIILEYYPSASMCKILVDDSRIIKVPTVLSPSESP